MQETGVHNGAFGADKFGFKKLKRVNWNFGAPQLYEHSLRAGEAVVSADGALCADTGVFTGRSPKDKFTVRDALTGPPHVVVGQRVDHLRTVRRALR